MFMDVSAVSVTCSFLLTNLFLIIKKLFFPYILKVFLTQHNIVS